MDKMRVEVIKSKGKKIYKDDRNYYIMHKGMRLVVDEPIIKKH